MTTLDANLLQVYKNMVGLGNIQNVSGNSTFLGGVSVNSNLYVSSTAIFNNSVTVRGGLYVSGLTIINNATTILSSLKVSGSTIINGATSILSNLNVSGNTYITGNLSVSGPSIYFNGATTIGSSLSVSGTGFFQQAIYTNSINALNNNLTIDGQIINIGNANSNVYINGTSTYIATTNLQIIDKLISLNINSSTLLGIDSGGNSGIEILGTSGTGYIKTNPDGTSFIIKAPANPNSGYIVIQDLNNSIYITGTSTLIGSTSVSSDLLVSGNTILQGSTSILSSLNVSGFTIINGNTTINNNLNVSGNTIIYGATTMNSSLNVSGNTCIIGNTTIVNSLYVSGNSVTNGNVSITSTLVVSGNSAIIGSQTIGNSLYVSGSSYLQSTTILSTLSVSGTTIINSSASISSNLCVSGTTVIGGNVSINSSLSISGSSAIYGNASLMSSLNILGNIIASLPNYHSNAQAAAAGIPVWGWYRTGSILKIRLDENPPTIILKGPASIKLTASNSFTDPGATSIAYDSSGNIVSIYMVSLVSNAASTINLLSSNILISGTTTIIPQTSSLAAGTYTATYLATDLNGFTMSASRIWILDINLDKDSSLILYYRFNIGDSNGNTLYNYATGSPVADGILNNGATISTSDYKVGNASLQLNGNSQYVSINNLNISSTIGMSFCFWFKSINNIEGTLATPFTFFNNGSYGGRRIFFSNTNNWQQSNSLLFQVDIEDSIKVYNGPQILQSGNNYNNSVWTHIGWTLTYSNTGTETPCTGGTTSTWNIYINGSLAYTFNNMNYPMAQSPVGWAWIGSAYWNASGSAFRGYIDDFRVYNRILLSSEISTIYSKIL